MRPAEPLAAGPPPLKEEPCGERGAAVPGTGGLLRTSATSFFGRHRNPGGAGLWGGAAPRPAPAQSLPRGSCSRLAQSPGPRVLPPGPERCPPLSLRCLRPPGGLAPHGEAGPALRLSVKKKQQPVAAPPCQRKTSSRPFPTHTSPPAGAAFAHAEMLGLRGEPRRQTRGIPASLLGAPELEEGWAARLATDRSPGARARGRP